MPKPHTLTPGNRAAFLEALATCGGFVRLAASIARLKWRTVYDWLQRGESGEEPFAEFLQETLAIRAECAKEQVGNHRRLAQQNGPHAAMASQYLLAALFPGEFGNKAQTAAAVDDALQRTLDAVQPLMSESAYDELVSALASLAGHGRVADEEASGAVAAEAEGETVETGGREPLALPASTRPDEGAG